MIFFFNYRRVRAAIFNETFAPLMNEMFGEERTRRLRQELSELPLEAREGRIVGEIREALAEVGADYIRHQRFAEESGAISHYLFYLGKSPKGAQIMGDIMAQYSSEAPGGVPSFSHTTRAQLPLLQAPSVDPIVQLAEVLLREFAGRTLAVEAIFAEHSRTSSRYVFRNYQGALRLLESGEKVKASPASAARRKGTLDKSVTITFPRREREHR